MHFVSLSPKKSIADGLSGVRNRARELATRAKSAADWLQTLPPQTGIIAVTDARRGIFCKYVNIYTFPYRKNYADWHRQRRTDPLSVACRPFFVAQGARQMGYQAAKLLHRLLIKKKCRYSEFWSHQFASLNGLNRLPFADRSRRYSGHALHCNHACKGIKVDQVLDAVGISAPILRSVLKKRWVKPSMP